MNVDRFLANIRRHAQLTTEDEQAFCSLLSIKHLKRKEYLLREGEESRNEYYINKGCIRSYYLDKKGVEHNIYFAVEDWWVSDLYSKTLAVPAICSIVAVENTELVQISNTDLEAFLQEKPALERFFRVSYQNALASHHLKTLQMLSMTGEERYEYFRHKFPEFDKRIPQKHIATYLGFTPEFFNTIRSKVLRGTKQNIALKQG